MKIVIEVDELQRAILNEINTKRFAKALEGHSQEFKSGAMFGMSWAGLLPSQCKQYAIMEEEDHA